MDKLKLLFDETCTQMDAELIEFGGEDDHIHLMVCIPPKLAISNLVGKLKGKSSYFLPQEYWPQIKQKLWGNHLWSPSYCVVSCGGAPLVRELTIKCPSQSSWYKAHLANKLDLGITFQRKLNPTNR